MGSQQSAVAAEVPNPQPVKRSVTIVDRPLLPAGWHYSPYVAPSLFAASPLIVLAASRVELSARSTPPTIYSGVAVCPRTNRVFVVARALNGGRPAGLKMFTPEGETYEYSGPTGRWRTFAAAEAERLRNRPSVQPATPSSASALQQVLGAQPEDITLHVRPASEGNSAGEVVLYVADASLHCLKRLTVLSEHEHKALQQQHRQEADEAEAEAEAEMAAANEQKAVSSVDSSSLPQRWGCARLHSRSWKAEPVERDSTAPSFFEPMSLVCDAQGGLIVADAFAHSLTRVVAPIQLEPLRGTGRLLADTGFGRMPVELIRLIDGYLRTDTDLEFQTVCSRSNDATFVLPHAIAIARNTGDLFIVNGSAVVFHVRAVPGETGKFDSNIQRIDAGERIFGTLTGIAAKADGSALFVSSVTQHALFKIDLTSKTITQLFAAVVTGDGDVTVDSDRVRCRRPGRIALDAAGQTLYVCHPHCITMLPLQM